MEYLDNYKIELHSIEQLNDERIAITFEPKYEYMVENPHPIWYAFCIQYSAFNL